MNATSVAGNQRRASSRLHGLEPFDALVFVLVVLLAFAVIGPMILSGKALTGGEGLYPIDQLQYLSWVRQAADHWLIGNKWDMAPDTRVMLHPAFLLSGLAVRWFGMPIEYSNLAIWKPVAILIVFFGARQYTRRLLPAGWPSRVALVLAIFVLAPMSSIAHRIAPDVRFEFNLDFITSEMWPGQQLLGYEVAAAAIFLVPLVLLAVERARERRDRALTFICAIAALLVMWLQPWQGVELILIVLATEAWRWWRRGIQPYWPLASLAVIGSIPAFYYAILERTDATWAMLAKNTKADFQTINDWSPLAVSVCLAPLAVPALVSLRNKADGWQGTAVRIWPLAVAFVYLQPLGTFPYHAIQGLSVPLAVMAVQAFCIDRPGWVPKPRWWWVLPVVLVLTVPGTVHRLAIARDNMNQFPYAFRNGERQALAWIESNPAPGAVIADSYGGLLVPAFTGREAYVGTPPFTPDFLLRSLRSRMILTSTTPPRFAQLLVGETGGSFIFQTCVGKSWPSPDLKPTLGPMILESKAFGCARAYRLRTTPEALSYSSRSQSGRIRK